MIYYHTVGLQLVLEVAHQIFVLTMLVTEEKGMSSAEKDPEPGSSTPNIWSSILSGNNKHVYSSEIYTKIMVHLQI